MPYSLHYHSVIPQGGTESRFSIRFPIKTFGNNRRKQLFLKLYLRDAITQYFI